jgi:hypothetical protein
VKKKTVVKRSKRSWRAEATVSPYDSIADLIGVVDGGDPKRSQGMGRRFSELLKARRSRP